MRRSAGPARFGRACPALLAAVSLVGCGSAARAGGGDADPTRAQQVANGPVAPGPGPIPLAVKLANPRDPVRVPFKHPPRSGLLFDLDTGRVLWRHQPERVLPIASLTKMMTALLVVENSKPDYRVRVTKAALNYEGSAIGLLPKGKLIRLETMLNGLLIVSGNDAAIALAQRVGGTVPKFVAMMNTRARDLGLRCTRFSAPDG